MKCAPALMNLHFHITRLSVYEPTQAKVHNKVWLKPQKNIHNKDSPLSVFISNNPQIQKRSLLTGFLKCFKKGR